MNATFALHAMPSQLHYVSTLLKYNIVPLGNTHPTHTELRLRAATLRIGNHTRKHNTHSHKNTLVRTDYLSQARAHTDTTMYFKRNTLL